MILRNAIKCDNCRAVIESRHVHDFVWCRCPEESYFRCAVDGGLQYLKRVGAGNWEDLSEVIDNTREVRAIREMKEKYPQLRIDCEAGWWGLVLELHKTLKRLDPDYTPLQIKQKFGGLRYYYDTDKGAEVQELMEEQVRKYEKVAETTCEYTGRQGAKLFKVGSWYTTLHPEAAPDDAVLVEQTPQSFFLGQESE